jgi:hypothetical protein
MISDDDHDTDDVMIGRNDNQEYNYYLTAMIMVMMMIVNDYNIVT